MQTVYGPFYSKDVAEVIAKRKNGYVEMRRDGVGPYYLVFSHQEYDLYTVRPVSQV